jgi:hypothetical protein
MALSKNYFIGPTCYDSLRIPRTGTEEVLSMKKNGGEPEGQIMAETPLRKKII